MAREKGRKQKKRSQVFLKILFWALDLKQNPLEEEPTNGKNWSFGPTCELGRFSASLSRAGVFFYLSSRWVVETDFRSGWSTHRSKNAWIFLTLLCWFSMSRQFSNQTRRRNIAKGTTGRRVWKKFSFWPSLSSQICNKLLPTRSSSSTSASVIISTKFELASLHARVTSIRSTKRHRVSYLVS